MADKHNTLFIGAKGLLLCGFDSWKLFPEEAFVDVKAPPSTIERSPGFHREWLNACRGGAPASCHFDYAGPLTEAVLLANIAYRIRGDFEVDPICWTVGGLVYGVAPLGGGPRDPLNGSRAATRRFTGCFPFGVPLF
jgi:hypothetical protein